MTTSLYSRGISLVNEFGNRFPIFVNDPHTIIDYGSYKYRNKQIKESMKAIVDSFIKHLSFSSKMEASMFMRGYWKHNFILFIQDEEAIGLVPNIPLLDLILRFSIKFNCMDVFKQCLEVVDILIFKETPNCKINSDVISHIMYSSQKDKLHFEWTYGESDWSVKLTEK